MKSSRPRGGVMQTSENMLNDVKWRNAGRIHHRWAGRQRSQKFWQEYKSIFGPSALGDEMVVCYGDNVTSERWCWLVSEANDEARNKTNVALRSFASMKKPARRRT